ncbi:hypothetical protein [Sporosarcina jiandibaonis]|uniref:hypothetical protein n=1 Tax=Sporosarcina jiandibaonis TaxID=2715535 RepID=UPI001556AC5C|nr:hypothetical protein [Sporosarcina jiandibaonis]
MFRSWKFIFLVIVSVFFLAACGKSLEVRIGEGLRSAEKVFYENNKVANEQIDGVKFYKPSEFTIKEGSDSQNIILTTKKDTFILFNNPNEKMDSRLFYDLLKADDTKKIIDEKTFTDGDIFGFAAVVENNDTVELIASVGGTKITTLAKKRDVASHLTVMMEILRSIQKK